jgi:hypothetical protein
VCIEIAAHESTWLVNFSPHPDLSANYIHTRLERKLVFKKSKYVVKKSTAIDLGKLVQWIIAIFIKFSSKISALLFTASSGKIL